MRIIALIAVLYLLASCAGGPPTFSADVTSADGKRVMHIAGQVDDKRPWLERYGGPAGALLSGIGYLAGQILTGGTLPTP